MLRMNSFITSYINKSWLALRRLALLSAMILVFCVSATAKPLSETDTLKRVLTELDAQHALIDEAIHRSDRQDRFRFDYAQLQQDLHVIRHGLRAAIVGTRFTPTHYKAINGGYGTVGVVGEAAVLQMLIQELQALTPLLFEAQTQANGMLRQKLIYQALHVDLDTVISGLQQALAGSADHPRRLPALRGEFSHG